LMPHREITVTVRDNEFAEQVKSVVSTIQGVVNVEILEPKAGRSRVRVDFTGDDDGVAALNQSLSAAGIAVLGFSEETKDLEAMFMRVTKGVVT
jgi:ABC-2 type transport system ATP-binding protein